jgi:hypothetical protein
MEIILTVGIFLSSFLVLSIEKNWWGGYLTEENTRFHNKAALFLEPIHSHRIFQTYKQELYAFNNLLRLVIVANSISFFIIISLLEIFQKIITLVYG